MGGDVVHLPAATAESFLEFGSTFGVFAVGEAVEPLLVDEVNVPRLA